MKKIFTIILAAAGTISFASAQSIDHKSMAYNDHQKISNDHARPSIDVKSYNINYNDAYYPNKEKEARIENINREFDQKIAFVKHDRRLTKREKNRQIQMLQNQRKNEISSVEFQYAKNDHRSDNRNFGHDEHKW